MSTGVSSCVFYGSVLAVGFCVLPYVQISVACVLLILFFFDGTTVQCGRLPPQHFPTELGTSTKQPLASAVLTEY
jgi:hypothetical protein